METTETYPIADSQNLKQENKKTRKQENKKTRKLESNYLKSLTLCVHKKPMS